MWRLWNKLFGWHYVALRYKEGVIIKKIDIRGGRYYFQKRCKYGIYFSPITQTIETVSLMVAPNKITPLTFKPEELIK